MTKVPKARDYGPVQFLIRPILFQIGLMGLKNIQQNLKGEKIYSQEMFCTHLKSENGGNMCPFCAAH